MNFILLCFFILSVCEGSLGLSVLVSLTRGVGNDDFQSSRMLPRLGIHVPAATNNF
jgi:hypothetical protein